MIHLSTQHCFWSTVLCQHQLCLSLIVIVSRAVIVMQLQERHVPSKVCLNHVNKKQQLRLILSYAFERVILRQIDKTFRSPRRQKVFGACKEEKRTKCFSTIPLSSSHKTSFSLSPKLMITQQSNSSYSRVSFPLNSVLMII